MRSKILLMATPFVLSILLLSMSAGTLLVELLVCSEIVTQPENASNSSEMEPPSRVYEGEGYVTLYRHDFDEPDPYWEWYVLEGGTGSAAIRGGYALLNMSDETKDGAHAKVVGWGSHPALGQAMWLHASMEIRLRCSDRNQLGGEQGGGLRAWGLVSRPEWPEHCLIFLSWSPGSIPARVGFWAKGKAENLVVAWEELEDVDMSDWHTYTLIWEENASTFLVDDVEVGVANRSPTTPMLADVFFENLYHAGIQDNSGLMDVAGNTSIEVDYVRLFASKARFESWADEVTLAEELIAEAEGKGVNTTDLSAFLTQAKEFWREGFYNYHLAKPHLDRIIPYLEHYDEVGEMFSLCEGLVESSKQGSLPDRSIRMMEGYLAQAGRYWGEYNYEHALLNLEKIITLAQPEG